jgi:hypothetical protein
MGAAGGRTAVRAGGAVLIATAFLFATAAPLATYTLALAVFGLPHVLSELRYVDHRFASRVDARAKMAFVLCLAAIVLVRLVGVTALLPTWASITIELMLNAAMTAAVLPLIGRRAAVAAVGFLLFACAWRFPFQTIALLAVAHNVTPVAFLADALERPARRRMLRLAGVVFVALPALIASGLPQAWLAGAGLFAPDLAAFDVGPLARNLGAYLPPDLHHASWATAAFSAAVFGQLMHYAAVIGWLPRLIPAGPAATMLRWPRAGAFWAGVALAALGMLALFTLDYYTARIVYGLAAAVHASVEIPLIAVALAGLRRPLGQHADRDPGRERGAVAQPG